MNRAFLADSKGYKKPDCACNYYQSPVLNEVESHVSKKQTPPDPKWLTVWTKSQVVA